MEAHRIRVVILGSTGMIGHKIFQLLSSNVDIDLVNVSRSRLNETTEILDLCDLELLRKKLSFWKADFIVNAAGVLIAEAEAYPQRALLLNALMPLTLAQYSIEYDYRVIQISTDCVFSGQKGPYTSEDPTDSHSVYGKTKALGEVIDDRNLTIRTSVIGPDLKSQGEELFSWFMRQSGPVDGYMSSMWSGVTTLELARSIEAVITDKFVSGLHHLTSGLPISKNQLLKIIEEKCMTNIGVFDVPGVVTNKVLISDGGLSQNLPISYNDLIEEMVADIVESACYPHYRDIRKLAK